MRCEIAAALKKVKAYGEVPSRRRLCAALLGSIAGHLVVAALVLGFSPEAGFHADSPGAQQTLSVSLPDGIAAESVESSSEIMSVSEAVPDTVDTAVVNEPQLAREPEAQVVGAARTLAASAPSDAKTDSEASPTVATPYFSAEWLGRRPAPLFPISPRYPPTIDGVKGQVNLLLLINEKGSVDGFRVLLSQPPGVFDQESIKAFTRARYTPGRIAGKPVNSEFVVEIRFEPGDEPSVRLAR